jgi:hypothetical protein
MDATPIQSDVAGKGPLSIVPQMQGEGGYLQNFYMESKQGWKGSSSR